MTVASLAEDWLVNNSVIAFVGALLVSQSLSTTERTVKWFGIFTIPDYSDWLKILLIVLLLAISIFCGVASVVPALRGWAVRHGASWSPGLSLMTWLLFAAALPPGLTQLHAGQWWSVALFLIGAILFIFLFIRWIRQIF